MRSLTLSFFYNTATIEIYTLSLHDALPICEGACDRSGLRTGPCPARLDRDVRRQRPRRCRAALGASAREVVRSEEHTSELQSHVNLVCRRLLEKKKNEATNEVRN